MTLLQESREGLKWSPIIFTTGGEGLVGSRFHKLISQEYAQVTSTDIDKIDITDGEAVNHWIEKYRPDVLINFSAMTDVRAIEKERGNLDGGAWRVNALGAENLAEACLTNKAFLIHISTDFVFPGYPAVPEAGLFAEDAEVAQSPDEVSWYGWTKREGERLVQEKMRRGGEYVIVRITRPIRAEFERDDFARNILKLYSEGRLYPMMNDMSASPTYIDELTEALKRLIQIRQPLFFSQPDQRILHVVSCDQMTIFDYSDSLIRKFTGKEPMIEGVMMKDFYEQHPNMYKLPKAGLLSDYTQKLLGMRFMSCREQIEELYRQREALGLIVSRDPVFVS